MKRTHTKEKTIWMEERVWYICGSAPIYAVVAFLEKST
jgi:hypothetical protein